MASGGGVTTDSNGRVIQLDLRDNQLRGEIPPELGGLSNLTGLVLGANQLTGEIPPELGRLSNLTRLRLSNNQLTGCIPEGLRDIANNDLGQLNLPDCGAATPGPTATLTPDLVVGTPTVDASAPAAGARFTLSATVRNQGNGSSDSTTLRYYRSTDATITTSDTSVGSDSVSGLNPSGVSAESITLAAPSAAGTYYYGACVDSVTNESDTTNNCSVAVTVVVGTAPAPDLVVDTPTVSDSGPNARVSFTLNATVRNQGSGPSAFTTLRYYRSTDSTISTGDTEVGTDSVSGLNASGSSPESISLTAPSTSGTYYYGACVEAVTGESDTTNNCSSAVAVTVSSGNTYGVGDFLPGIPRTGLFIPAVTVGASLLGSGGSTTITFNNGGYIELQDGTRYTCQSTDGCGVHNGEITRGTLVSQTTSALTSDMIVDPPTVSESAPAVETRFTLNATVRNQGSGSSSSTTLRYYRSTDATITTSDTSVGTDSVSGLNASGSSPESISLTGKLRERRDGRGYQRRRRLLVSLPTLTVRQRPRRGGTGGIGRS